MRRHLRADLGETPIDRGSVTRCDGEGVNRANGWGCRASAGGRLGTALPRVRRPFDQADRRPARSLIGTARRTSTTRPGRRHGRSRRAMSACAAAAARTPSRAAARATRTPIAGPATPVRSSGGGPGSAWSRRCSIGAATTASCRPPPSGRARDARRRGGEALRRLAGGEWPAASVVSRLFGSWSAAYAAACGDDRQRAREPASAS